MADIPAGTGLGSSGSFTVGVLKALHSHLRRPVTNEELAALACHVEIDRLGEPVGKQDQYAAAIGGLTAFHFHPDGTVAVEPVAMPEERQADARGEPPALLHRGAALGVGRDRRAGRRRRRRATPIDDNLKAVRELGYESCRGARARAISTRSPSC